MSHWYSNGFNYFSPSDTFNQTRHQNADIASWREKMWYFFFSKKKHSAEQYCILCHLAIRYGDLPGNISLSEEQNKCVHFSMLKHLWAVDVALEKDYTCFLYVCFAGSVLFRLILTICIYQQSSKEGHTWELRAGLSIQSQVEGVGPLLGVTQDCSV